MNVFSMAITREPHCDDGCHEDEDAMTTTDRDDWKESMAIREEDIVDEDEDRRNDSQTKTKVSLKIAAISW